MTTTGYTLNPLYQSGSAPPPPVGIDLTVGSLTADSLLWDDTDVITLDCVATNGGDTAAASSTVEFYISTTNPPTVSDTLLGSTTTGALAAGATANLQITPTIDYSGMSLAGGVYYVAAFIDTGGTVTEVDEANNVSNILTVSLASAASLLPAAQSWLLIPDMTPTGTVHAVSNDTEFRDKWKLAVAGDVIELAAGASFGAFYYKAGSNGTPNYGQIKVGTKTAANNTYTAPNLNPLIGEFILIRSADPTNKAKIAKIECLNSTDGSGKAEGIRFENVDIDNTTSTVALNVRTSYFRFTGTKAYTIPDDPATGRATNTRPYITHDTTRSNYKDWMPAVWASTTENSIFLQGASNYIAHCDIYASQNPIIMEESVGSDNSFINDVSVDGYDGDCFRGNGINVLYQDCWARNTYSNDTTDHYDAIQIANSLRTYTGGIYRRNVFLGWDATHGRGLFTGGAARYWSNLTNYTTGDYCFGSDRLVYVAVADNGPSTTVQDPVTDATDTYWEASKAVPASEQGFWSSDNPSNWLCEDNVLVQGGYQGANLGNAGSGNILRRNTIQFIAPSPGYNPPGRVYQTGSDVLTTATRVDGSSWSSVSENIYDENISGTDDGDNEVINNSDWATQFANAANERDFHVHPSVINPDVGPNWLRPVAKQSTSGVNTTITAPTASTLGIVDEMTVQLMVNNTLASMASNQSYVWWDSDGAGTQGRVLIYSDGRVQAQALGTNTTTGAGVYPASAWATVRISLNGPAGTIRVYLDGALIVTHTSAPFVIGDAAAIRFMDTANTVFNLNYLWVWYSAEADGRAPFRVPDKLIYGSPAVVNADSWATGADFV